MIILRPFWIGTVYVYLQRVSCIYNVYYRIIYYKTPVYVVYHFINSLPLSLNLSDLQSEVEPSWGFKLNSGTDGVQASR